MKRSPMPERRAPIGRARLRVVGASERAPRRRRDTGPAANGRLVIVARAGGLCEVCGRQLAWIDQGDVTFAGDYSIHHRQPRGMGGSRQPDTNAASSLLLVCGTATTPDGCHQLIESQRALAYTNGWLVRRPTDPATVPVLIHPGVRVYLAADGRYTEVS